MSELSIIRIIYQKCAEKNISKSILLSMIGYSNINKGIRRLNSLGKGNVEIEQYRLLRKICSVLVIDPLVLEESLAEWNLERAKDFFNVWFDSRKPISEIKKSRMCTRCPYYRYYKCSHINCKSDERQIKIQKWAGPIRPEYCPLREIIDEGSQ
ncbi:MAG: hypothetical protein JW794_10070 [Candidatus Cloacimonetes bacterium]|nr:hypothetical protein [Candidatus Cloacimonadota bacterium]